MKFFFPDSSDLVDPTFDFETEARSADRVRQRDDLYAHECFDSAPFDGILVSKAIVDGSGSGGRYTLAQRQRLQRQGVRAYFRLDKSVGRPRLATMGDCGAFSYVREERPPYSPQEVVDFYSECGFDFGLSIDHVILGFRAELDGCLPRLNQPPKEWKDRQELTLALADEFLKLHRVEGHRFMPLGVAQGWSPESYARAVVELERMGFSYIAIGGLVPLKTDEISASLEAIGEARNSSTRLHLLGITRLERLREFSARGAVSFDSTSPLRQAFKDDRHNYYTIDRTYSAIRVPQVAGNPRLQRQIGAGVVDPDLARQRELECLELLKLYDRESVPLDDVLDRLRAYDTLLGDRSDRSDRYREVLSAKPWKQCSCNICKQLGIQVIVFRGAERNRRRGFHNLYITYQRLHRELALAEPVES